ncbi:MAG TPA: saccharopine dehydrogenase NADP-binding domain-containing protein, partial [Saprospiraceae bacterium]|nr:saccharopine dehydrogenase NADP-binding domain-containing protein [Saprospiraceae bacterium]
MNNLLIIGAGRSATALINYILDAARQHNFFVTVADANLEMAQHKVAGRPNGRAFRLDASKTNDRRDIIQRHDVVVSLLPPQMHLDLAQD